MKVYQLLTLIILFTSCRKESSIKEVLKTDELTFGYIENVQDKNILNDSNHKVDILYNGIDKYLGGKKNLGVHFQTEWLPDEQVQVLEEGLLFANRILITQDKIRYFKNDIVSKSKNIPLLSDHRERNNPHSTFSTSQVKIKYKGMSCNDADFNTVKIQYKDGFVEIDSILNAAVFEYDLNLNGQPEQYVIGSRNCSQEFVLLRITAKPSR